MHYADFGNTETTTLADLVAIACLASTIDANPQRAEVLGLTVESFGRFATLVFDSDWRMWHKVRYGPECHVNGRCYCVRGDCR